MSIPKAGPQGGYFPGRQGLVFMMAALIPFLLSDLTAVVQEPVHLIRMADDATLAASFTKDDLDSFLAEHATRLVREQRDLPAGNDSWRQLLGQREIFEELRDLESSSGIQAQVGLVEWGDAFRFFADYITDQSNPPLVAQMGDTWVPFFESLRAIAFAERQTWDVRVIWYWRRLVDPARLETGESFVAVCEEIKNSTGKELLAPLGISTAVSWDLLHNLVIWLYNAGAEDLISTQPKWGFIPWKEATFADQAGESAAQFLIDLASRQLVDLPDHSATEVAEDFLQQKYAMILQGTWVGLRAREVLGPDWTSELGFTLPPRIGAERASTFKGGSYLVVIDPSRGGQTEALGRAIRVAKHLSSPESLERYWPATSDLPASKSVLQGNQLLRSFTDVLAHGRSYPVLPEWAPLVENLSTRDNLYAFWKRLSALTLSNSNITAEEQLERHRLVLAALRTAENDINRFLSPGQLANIQPWLVGLALFVAPIFGVSLWKRNRERRANEIKIRESEERYRDLYDNAPDMFCSVDSKTGQITQCNKTLVEKTGFGRDSLVGKHIREIYHPDSQPQLEAAIRTFRREGKVQNLEMQLLRKDGPTLDVSANFSAIKDQTGEISGFRTIWRDISQRKRAEMELQQQRQALAHVSRVATVGELAASLAHELNQPLAAIVSNAQAGQRILDIDPQDLGEIRETLRDIASDGKRAGDVIRHVRGLLRNGQVNRHLLDMNSVVESILELLHSDTALREISIEVELEPNLPPVCGDRVQLQQVILNLLLNASEAMLEQNEPRIIRVTTASDSENVQVRVADNGPGLDAEQRAQIFEAFYTTKSDGLGLGLSISRSIVEDHAGKLMAQAGQGRGLVMVFQLPIRAEPGCDEAETASAFPADSRTQVLPSSH